MDKEGQTRREFLKTAGLAGLLLGAPSLRWAANALAGENYNHEVEQYMPGLIQENRVKTNSYMDPKGRQVDIAWYHYNNVHIKTFSHKGRVYGYVLIKKNRGFLDSDGDGVLDTLKNNDFFVPNWVAQ